MCALVTGVQTCALPICHFPTRDVHVLARAHPLTLNDGLSQASMGTCKARVVLDGTPKMRFGNREQFNIPTLIQKRSEESRAGKECVSRFRYGGTRYH